MQTSDGERAVAAARSIASGLGLAVDDAVVLQDSNRVTVRLVPCDVVARVAPAAYRTSTAFEVELAQQLAAVESPVAALDPRVEPLVYERDDFVMNLWTYYEPTGRDVPSADYASALERLHAGLRQTDLTTPRFTDRVAEARELIESPELTPALPDDDRELVSDALRTLSRAIGDREPAEQLLHGEPHPGNLLSTSDGLRFIDLETSCRGPVEFDVAHSPDEVGDHYPGTDHELLSDCRGLILAVVSAWRWDPADSLPNGRRAARELLRGLREGPPWPTLDTVRRRMEGTPSR